MDRKTIRIRGEIEKHTVYNAKLVAFAPHLNFAHARARLIGPRPKVRSNAPTGTLGRTSAGTPLPESREHGPSVARVARPSRQCQPA
jgi:hypothetical protein